MKIDVVVVNWNGEQFIEQCISSLIGNSNSCIEKIIVVDNASGDRSLDILDRFADIEVIRSQGNLGFAKACNVGAACGGAPYLLFFNPDARLMPGTLDYVIDFMDDLENSAVGICGVRLIADDGSTQRTCARFPTASRLVAQSLGLHRIVSGLATEMRAWNHDSTRFVDQVMGAFFLTRRRLFSDLGGFDERFFVYFEEVDFSKRAFDAGYRSAFLSDSRAYHTGGGLSGQVRAHRLFYSLRSRILYGFKHFSPPAAMTVAGTTLMVEFGARALPLLIRGRWIGLHELQQAYGMLWSWAYQALREKQK